MLRRVIALLITASLSVASMPAAGVGPVVQPAGEIFHVSADPAGGDHDGAIARDPVAASEGRSVAFRSDAPDLVLDDTNGRQDVFVWTRATGQTERVSLSTSGGQGNGHSFAPSISADGRYVLFTSDATDLVPGDDNGRADAFLRDRILGTTERIQTVEGSCRSVMSADARYVLCGASRPALFGSRVFQVAHAVVLDRLTGQIEFASVGNDGRLAAFGMGAATMSPSGRFVAFTSGSTDLHPGMTSGSSHVFVRDLVEDRTWLASVNNAGEPAIYRPWAMGISWNPSVANNGRVAFESFNNNIEPTANADAFFRSYVHDPVTHTTTLAVTSLSGGRPANQTQWPAISPDGRRVAVTSIGNDLLPSTGFAWRIVMRDLETNVLVDLTATHDGSPPIAISQDARFSPDGSAVAFMSRASNLLPGLSGTSRHRSYLRLLTAPAPPPKPNTLPTIDAGGDVRLPQGSGTVTRQGSFSDPDEGQTWSAEVDYGDGSGVAPLALAPDRTFQLSRAYSGTGPFDVSVTVRDSAGGVGTGGFRVTVNRPPVVDAGPNAGAFPWTPFERTGTFSDPDPGQTWSVRVDYGDGSPVASVVPFFGSAFRLSHEYERTGTFTVTVTVTDDMGASGFSSFEVRISPARSFIFVHGITGSFRETSFEALLTPLRALYRGREQIRRFEYWQDAGRARDPTTVCDAAKGARRADFDPSADPHGMPLTLSARSLSEAICDSQSDIGINAMLLDHDVLAMHERFGGKVTIVANSMGGAITRAYLAYAAAGRMPSLDHVDQVVVVHGAQQGSYTTLARPAVSSALGPLGGVVIPVVADAVRQTLRYDIYSPGFDDLTPLSEMYRWVNPDADHVPPDVAYVNVASDIHLIVGADLFGLVRVSLADLPAGDYAILPGSDDPRALPFLGGERFDPRTIGRGAPGSTQYVLHRDVLVPMELFRAVIERGPSVTVDDILARIRVPEWHGAIGEEMGQITVQDGSTLRSLDEALIERMRSLGP